MFNILWYVQICQSIMIYFGKKNHFNNIFSIYTKKIYFKKENTLHYIQIIKKKKTFKWHMHYLSYKFYIIFLYNNYIILFHVLCEFANGSIIIWKQCIGLFVVLTYRAQLYKTKKKKKLSISRNLLTVNYYIKRKNK